MEMFGGRGRLGVRVESLSPDLASYFGGRDTRGALVLEVTDGSAAKRAGIRAGDVITRLDDKRIESADDLIEAVRSGDGRVTVRVMRHGSSQSLEATLGAADRDLRIRRPEGFNFNWNGRPGARGSDPNRRIIIRGDEPRSGELSPKEREELRKQMEELREQMRQLREKIRSEQDRE
jgi:membrane-associated protease RseP (regulator of RpoE activity)